jgi:oxygen-independent coproporphyrinogen-3 oxidase
MSGIYIHIPFCKQACSYCDFHFTTTFEKYRTKLIHALCDEIVMRKNELPEQPLMSIYFGGGTPSLLTIKELSNILTTIKSHFTLHAQCEITLECNPDDISASKAEHWKSEGINRLSIGVQSFMNQDLTWMNRAHDAKEAQKALAIVKKAKIPMTLDLIYGLPGTSITDWRQNIEKAISFQPEHISAYCLTIEPRTKLARQISNGDIEPCSEEDQASQFDLLVTLLRENNYEQYEISNFAKNEFYAIHNTAYWTGKPYLGIGPSAHSFDGEFIRQWNINNNARYIKGIEINDPVIEKEKLSPNDRFNEMILTGLRTKWGVNLASLSDLSPLSKSFLKTKSTYLLSESLIEKGDFLMLTEKGKLIADRIASDLFVD